MGPSKKKKPCYLAVAALLLATLPGCALLGDVFGPTEDFSVTLCGEGAVVIPCRTLVEKLSVPEGGESFIALVVGVAGPYLAREVQLKSCLFTTFAEGVGREIVVTATGACLLQGQTVQEKLTITLAPVAVGAA